MQRFRMIRHGILQILICDLEGSPAVRIKNMGKNISFLRESVGLPAYALFDEIPELVGMKWDVTHFAAAETMHGVEMQGREYERQQSEKMAGY